MSNTIKNKSEKLFRTPKTKQEKTKFEDAKDQGVKVRGKRLPNRLPDDWDDDFISTGLKKQNKSKKPSKKTIRMEEDEQSISKTMKDKGKITIKGPKVKERKKFAPATKVEKPKKGKGSYTRDKTLEENTNIIKFIENILTKNYSEADKYIKRALESKLESKIKEELSTPLFQ